MSYSNNKQKDQATAPCFLRFKMRMNLIDRYDIMFLFESDKSEFVEAVQMNEQVKDYIDKYPSEIIDVYYNLRKMIFDSVSCEPEERLWAKIPTYYVGEAFVRLIPFKDHINVEAQAIIQHKEELAYYKITPKGMVQIRLKQDIPYDVLKQIFAETLER